MLLSSCSTIEINFNLDIPPAAAPSGRRADSKSVPGSLAVAVSMGWGWRNRFFSVLESVSRKRSRSDQVPQGDPGRAHAAGRLHPSLVPAVGGGVGNPEHLPEPAGFRTLCHPPPQRAHGGFGP